MFKEEMVEEFSKTERQKLLVSRTITNPKRDKKIYTIYILSVMFGSFTRKKQYLKSGLSKRDYLLRNDNYTDN